MSRIEEPSFRHLFKRWRQTVCKGEDRRRDRDDIDGFDKDVLLRKLSCDVDLRIEPHSFARTDFDETDPYIKEIVETGERIL